MTGLVHLLLRTPVHVCKSLQLPDVIKICLESKFLTDCVPPQSWMSQWEWKCQWLAKQYFRCTWLISSLLITTILCTKSMKLQEIKWEHSLSPQKFLHASVSKHFPQIWFRTWSELTSCKSILFISIHTHTFFISSLKDCEQGNQICILPKAKFPDFSGNSEVADSVLSSKWTVYSVLYFF